MLGTVLSRRGVTLRTETLWDDGLVARVRAWPHESSTAFLTLHGAHDDRLNMPSHVIVASWLERLRALGYTHVRTSAVSTTAQRVLEEHGFTPCQELVMLSMTLRSDHPRLVATQSRRKSMSTMTAMSLTRLHFNRRDHDEVLRIDQSAFGQKWSLDRKGLQSAFRATTTSRIFLLRNIAIRGFVLVGQSGSTGFIQRLAVEQNSQRSGFGTELLQHALQWLSAQGCGIVYVNTEHTNNAALSLYAAHGFTALSHGLTVLERALEVSAP